jgi:hypothetical protein
MILYYDGLQSEIAEVNETSARLLYILQSLMVPCVQFGDRMIPYIENNKKSDAKLQEQ